MKKLIFNYKRWYCKSLLISNLLIPLFILFSGFDSNNNFISFLGNGGSVSLGVRISAIASFLILIIGGVYVSKTFSSSRYLRHHISWKKEHSNKLMWGISLHAISSVFLLSCASFGVAWKISNNTFDSFKWVTYVLAGITLIIGMASNIFIHTFEFKNYFYVYYPRYKESAIKDALDGINQRKYLRRKALKG